MKFLKKFWTPEDIFDTADVGRTCFQSEDSSGQSVEKDGTRNCEGLLEQVGRHEQGNHVSPFRVLKVNPNQMQFSKLIK